MTENDLLDMYEKIISRPDNYCEEIYITDEEDIKTINSFKESIEPIRDRDIQIYIVNNKLVMRHAVIYDRNHI